MLLFATSVTGAPQEHHIFASRLVPAHEPFIDAGLGVELPAIDVELQLMRYGSMSDDP